MAAHDACRVCCGRVALSVVGAFAMVARGLNQLVSQRSCHSRKALGVIPKQPGTLCRLWIKAVLGGNFTIRSPVISM